MRYTKLRVIGEGTSTFANAVLYISWGLEKEKEKEKEEVDAGKMRYDSRCGAIGYYMNGKGY